MVRDTAASTPLPRLVPDRHLDVANGHLGAASSVGGELAGPAAGGALFGLAAALPLAINAAGLTLALLLLWTLPDVFAPLLPKQDSSCSSVMRTIGDEVYSGLTWLWRDRQLRRLTAATSLVLTADGAFSESSSSTSPRFSANRREPMESARCRGPRRLDLRSHNPALRLDRCPDHIRCRDGDGTADRWRHR